MKVKGFTAVGFQLFENFRVIYRKLKLIACNTSCSAFSKAFLNQFAFIGFENIPFFMA